MSSHSKRYLILLLGFIALLLCLGCIGSATWFYNLDAPSIEQGKKGAEPILFAIKTYKEKEGSYPPALSRLMPDYLRNIPKPDPRHEYCYYLREDGLSFTLSFVPKGEAIGDGWVVYSSILNEWQRTDSDFYYECQFFFDLRD